MAGSGDVPPLIEDRLRAVCLGLPDAYEELAWIGIRWRVRGRTFAHVCTVEADHPTSHARVFATDGPVCVVTFRAPAREVGGLIGSGFPFYWPGWGVNVVGMVLHAHIDWTEVAELLIDSYRVQAPKKLARIIDQTPRHAGA
ncbi:MAG TPA: MmcQ/YjbR family DNA-binding protein [Candidatus Limnocylindrales bacterium]|nr:MmcQ/YjbR family DNA-binding protein [Candidatus Limnocylindrales bacterium]